MHQRLAYGRDVFEDRWKVELFISCIDKSGKLIDVYLSDTRDEQAAKKFFSNCKETTGITPDQITTDKEKVFPEALKYPS